MKRLMESFLRAARTMVVLGLMISIWKGGSIVYASEMVVDAGEMTDKKEYVNPMDIAHAWQEGELGDPFVMRFNGRFYLYCSGWDIYLKCWSSENLVDWKYEGEVARDQELRNGYAPEVIYARDGYFYMVTSPQGTGHRVLRATSPLGPFEIITDNIGRSIDGSLFFDDDGSEYFYHADGSGVKSSKVTNYTKFGLDKSTGAYLGHWTEGPQVFKRGKYYFMTFTGNHVLSEGYRIAYAVSSYPDREFVMPRNSQFVINTTDGYWALGHNSVVMGPDMDSYYIAFHNNRLYSPNRKFNLDRLFFNGSKLTTTAPNDWEQPVPSLPDFYAWADEGYGHTLKVNQVGNRDYTMSEAESMTDFIAEWNISSGNLRALFSYVDERNYGILELSGSVLRLSQLQEGKLSLLSEGSIPEGSNENAHHALRLEKTGEVLAVFYDGLHRLDGVTSLSGGHIAAAVDGGVLRYIAFTNDSGGVSDFSAPKSVPGTFDAVHYLPEKGVGYQSEGVNQSSYRSSDSVTIQESKSGSYAAMLKNSGDWFRYAISVKDSGLYSIDARLQGELDGSELLVSTEDGVKKSFPLQDSGAYDEEEFTVITLEDLTLEAGYHTLEFKLTKGRNVLLESFSSYQSAHVESTIQIIKDSARVQREGWRFYGSVAREFKTTDKGYIPPHIKTKAFTGDRGWQDYGVEASIPGGLEGTSGMLQLYLRSSNESWHADQVESAFFGYRLTIARKFLILEKCKYDNQKLADISLDQALTGEVHLRVLMKDQRLLVYMNEALVIDYTDPDPISHGRIGIGGSNPDRGFSELSVFPVTDEMMAVQKVSSSNPLIPDKAEEATAVSEEPDEAADRGKHFPAAVAVVAVAILMVLTCVVLMLRRRIGKDKRD